MTALRWGILSTARIGQKAVIPGILKSHNGHITAIASRDGEKGRAVALPVSQAQGGDPIRVYDSYDALLGDPDVDAIYNPLPNSLHAEWTIRAMQAGKHVLCEKPLGVDRAEVDTMIAAAQATDRVLMEAFMYRFHPRIQRALDLLTAGEIGRLHTIRGAFTFPLATDENIRLSAALAGGSLMDVGCYCVNIARTAVAALGGGEPVAVAAFADFGARTGVEESLSGILHFQLPGQAGVVSAHFDSSLRADGRQFFEFVGFDGTIRVDEAFNAGRFDNLRLQVLKNRQIVRDEQFDGMDQYQLMVEHFADAVLTGSPLRYPIHESRGNMATIDALLESARTGTVVKI
jgi:predicted dehydrogenase